MNSILEIVSSLRLYVSQKKKMHLTGNDYLTREEWNRMVQLAKDNYQELPWKAGGILDYEEYIKVID